jgi:acyl-coenzyme A synthetase/AMP-(fatty) acid ligase
VRSCEFLADVARVAAALPAAQHILNACADRYHFSVGFAAALCRGKVSLLPSTQTPEMLRQLLAFAPDVVLLSDEPQQANTLPYLEYPRGAPGAAATEMPRIDAKQYAACVFTSGSTGTPLAYRKSFGPLIACVREEAQRLGLVADSQSAIVATVPPQHMYGFESSVLLATGTGQALCAERPFYPADIAATLASVPRPRLLLTTPVHLRALTSAAMTLPPIDLIVCSTAPLAQQLAHECEQRFQARLL